MISPRRSGLNLFGVLWLFPAAIGATAVGFLCWGAWRGGYDPGWLASEHGYWVAVLRPDQSWALLVAPGLWLMVLPVYWWPRQYRQPQPPLGLIVVAGMVALAMVLGTASYVPCRAGLSLTGVALWVLQLFVGQPASAYPGAAVCTGPPPPALQLAQILGLAATLTGALTAGSALWRPSVERLVRSRLTGSATVFTGLDALTFPLLMRLIVTARSPRQVIVIEPNRAHPLLDDARSAGARVIVGDPASLVLLDPIMAGRRNPGLSQLYALRSDETENQVVLGSVMRLLERHRVTAYIEPRLVVRIDDIRRAIYWRGTQGDPEALVREDTLSVDECTARTLVEWIVHARRHMVLLCGGTSLSVALLLELARRSWEEEQFAAAASAGRNALLDQADPDTTDVAADNSLSLTSTGAVRKVILLDPHSTAIRREYLQITPKSILDHAPTVTTRDRHWKSELLRSLDALPEETAKQAAVVIADTLSDTDMHEVELVARLHPEVAIYAQLPPGGSIAVADFYGLRLFAPGLLVDGEVPEDPWTRIARFWHECYRLSRPVAPGNGITVHRRPWPELDITSRQDNLLQLKSILTAVAALDRLWIPAHMVPQGSFIELSERDLESVAEGEHTRWVNRRIAEGWAAGANPARSILRKTGSAAGRANGLLVPWTALPPEERAQSRDRVRLQIGQLEDIGFMPVVPVGGPDQAITVDLTGIVSASQLTKRKQRTRHAGQQTQGSVGHWRIVDEEGQSETMPDLEFRASHEPVGEGQWRRVGTFRAWQVRERLTIRTKEGARIADPGDWVLEGVDGGRWPVDDLQFRRRYRPRE